jgi:hypothetical protein
VIDCAPVLWYTGITTRAEYQGAFRSCAAFTNLLCGQSAPFYRTRVLAARVVTAASRKGRFAMLSITWRGYSTHDLDEAEQLHRLRTGKKAKFFAVPPKWYTTGSEDNIRRIVLTTLAGCNGIFIPLDISLSDFQDLLSARSEKRSTAPARREDFDIVEAGIEAIRFEEKRYCSYCGRLFVVDSDNPIIHCDNPACVTRHNDYLAHVEAVRAEEKKAPRYEHEVIRLKEEHKPENEPEPVDVTPDFELDDPYSGRLFGWVYFIEAENGLVKIGRSDNLKTRFSDLLTMSPVRLYLRHSVCATNYVKAESWLHSQFAAKRDHGEWFALSSEELEWAKSLKDYSLDRV